MKVQINVFFLLAICLVLVITFSPGEIRNIVVIKIRSLFESLVADQNPVTLEKKIEIVGHFITFVIVGLTAQSRLTKKQFAQGLLLIINIAALSELGQNLVPSRETSWEDFTVNVCAGIIGLILCLIFYKPKPTI